MQKYRIHSNEPEKKKTPRGTVYWTVTFTIAQVDESGFSQFNDSATLVTETAQTKAYCSEVAWRKSVEKLQELILG